MRVKRYKDGMPVEGGSVLDTNSVIFNGTYPTVPTLIQRTGETAYYGYDAQVATKKAILFHGFKTDLESPDEKRRQEARELRRNSWFILRQSTELRARAVIWETRTIRSVL